MADNRIILLISASCWTFNSALKFIESDLNVVGVCIADQKKAGFDFGYIWRSIKKRGLFHVLDQIFGRIFHVVLFARKEKKQLGQILDLKKIDAMQENWPVPVFHCKKYSDKDAQAWLKDLKPDIFVINTSEWVGKTVREIPSTKLVIGGHPGITPLYRGSHSAFWAKYNDDLENTGYSVFHVDQGVDTGDLVFQEHVPFTDELTYRSHSWICMDKTADAQVNILREYNRSGEIARMPHNEIPENSEYSIPGLSHKLYYLIKNRRCY